VPSTGAIAGLRGRNSSPGASLGFQKSEGLESPSYSILNKREILSPPIPSGIVDPKLVLGLLCHRGAAIHQGLGPWAHNHR
jgi:hypothetical protein